MVNAGVRIALTAAVALAALCLPASPSAANLVVQMDGVSQGGGKMGDRVKTTVGQKVYFQVGQMNKFPMPLISLCHLPMLHQQSRGILFPGQAQKTWLAAVCRRPGTYKLTAYFLYLNPYTGRLCEAVDTCVIVCEGKKGQQQGNPTGQTGNDPSWLPNDSPETDPSSEGSGEQPDGELPEEQAPETPGDTGMLLTNGPTNDPSLIGGLPQEGGEEPSGQGSGSKKDGGKQADGKKDGGKKGGGGKKHGK